jgi:polysaccharide transporter, PST family
VPSFGSGVVNRLRNWTLVNRLGIASTVKSISWLSAENFATTLIAAIVSIVVARTLGPAAAGTWGYVFAIYSVSLLLTTLGTDQIVIIDLVATREQRATIMTTALGLRMTASIAVALTLIAASFAISTKTPEQNPLIRVLAFSLIAMSFDVVGNWFRAQLRFDRIVIPSIVSTFIGGAAKIFFVIHEHSILPLGILTVGQSALMQGMIVFSAFRGGVGTILRGFSIRYARELLRASVPLMISGIAVFIYLRANVFFLNEFESKADVGLYNAAAAVSGVAYFIPTVIVTALTPSLYRRYNANRAQFERDFRHVTSILTLALALIAVAVMLLSHRIITLLYGVAFAPAAAVLALHVWTLIPAAYGLTSSVWLAAEKRTSVLMTRTICGGVVNVALNLLLIPRLGIIGAAIATLVAMFTASMFMLPFLGNTGRRIFVTQLRALFFADILAILFTPRRT